MAKYETRLTADFNEFLHFLDSAIVDGSISASRENGSSYTLDDVQCAMRVYERYSYIGSNRVSLSIMLLGQGRNLTLSAITSGGSQAMFFKINVFGEEAFLNKLMDAVKRYQER